jgi:hypothetical protein
LHLCRATALRDDPAANAPSRDAASLAFILVRCRKIRRARRPPFNVTPRPLLAGSPAAGTSARRSPGSVFGDADIHALCLPAGEITIKPFASKHRRQKPIAPSQPSHHRTGESYGGGLLPYFHLLPTQSRASTAAG